VNLRSAPWARAFTATAPKKNIIQASVCRQLSLKKSVALHAINKKKQLCKIRKQIGHNFDKSMPVIGDLFSVFSTFLRK